jgi:hypothetical protein
MEKLKAIPIAHKKDALFVAIITTDDERTLLAQCTSLVIARHLAKLYNASLLPDPIQDALNSGDGVYRP